DTGHAPISSPNQSAQNLGRYHRSPHFRQIHFLQRHEFTITKFSLFINGIEREYHRNGLVIKQVPAWKQKTQPKSPPNKPHLPLALSPPLT
ncbi:hypothetical protein, partial [Bifidobacterium longum]|uniref:hypothetical protein n=1 Tax=Bifidobacterium longum TaxID=216816 RepID=UPI001F3D8040